MSVGNARIADILDEVGDLLEISGENFFRVRAYHNAARAVRDLSTSLAVIDADPDRGLSDIPGIGKDLSKKIKTILDTGDLPLRIDLESHIPVGLMDVMKVAGLGPRKAHALFLELGVKDLESLGAAARSGKIKNVKGFGPRTEQNILEGIYTVKGMGNRIMWASAERLEQQVMDYMRELDCIKVIEPAGSFRRLVESVGDLDLLVVCDDAEAVAERFVSHPNVARLIARGPTKTSVVMGRDNQVDIRMVPGESFGAAWQYFTGSQAHGVAVRSMALRKGMKLNEYGVWRGDERVAGASEEDVYGLLGMEWIPPELRENRGEIRAALDGKLPRLLEEGDIRGDLHIHTTATDGHDTVETMVAEAKKMGYLYLAITDHTKRLKMVGGLDEEALLEHWQEVERVGRGAEGIHVLKGVEVDIMRDGTLDIADEVLARADWVIASVHYEMDLPRAEMTRRIVRAIENPHVDALGHATGRKINERPPYNVNMDDVMSAAVRTGTALELNANPSRLDIDDHWCRIAREHGVKVAVSTDAHSAKEMGLMRYGINQARRGWLEKDDVLNTMTHRSLMAHLLSARA